MTRLLPLLAALYATAALAHPFEKTSWSARSAMRAKDSGLVAVVVVEIPASVVLARLQTIAGERKPKKADVHALNQQIWEELGEPLSLSVDGAQIPGGWTPVDSKANGKGSEGFFVYLVQFEPDAPWELPDRYTVQLRNEGLREVPLYLSGMAKADVGWAVDACSAEDVLGAGSTEFTVNAEQSWSKNEALRTLTVTYRRDADSPGR